MNGANTSSALAQYFLFGAFDDTKRNRKLVHATPLHSADPNVPLDIGNGCDDGDDGENHDDAAQQILKTHVWTSSNC